MAIFKMKKVLKYLSVIILAFLFVIIVGIIVVNHSVFHVELPHGAVLHVLPNHRNNKANGAVIICSGGGYGHQSKWYEGYCWFPFYYFQGFTVALLEYRLPDHDPHVPIVDGAEAVQLMRARAEEWHFDRNNVGVMGFSAGGHLASTLMVSDKASVRPDFGILFYPVISMKRELTHPYSHDNLLGKNASEDLENQYSSELHVSDQTPPAYIATCSDDKTVDPQNAMRFSEAMRAYNRPTMLHVYPSGGHGWGYHLSFPHHQQMLDDLEEWLRSRRK